MSSSSCKDTACQAIPLNTRSFLHGCSYVEGGSTHCAHLDRPSGLGMAVWARTSASNKCLRAHVSLLHEPNPPLTDSLGNKIEHSFENEGLVFEDMKRALKIFPLTLVEGIWALVGNGELSNDTLLPLRTLRRKAQEGKFNSRRRHRMVPQRERLKRTEGRWWLVESCIHEEG